MDQEFDYNTAFKRNLGFLSASEQEKLRHTRVAIAGLGGTGGAQVAALSRLGIGAFTLADPDIYELANFNRQYGATMATIGEKKTEVAKQIIHGINPTADIRLFDQGVGEGNIAAFLEGADIVVDSLDFYCFKERLLLYPAARERGIWVLTAPPLGFGYTLLCFDPEGMSFLDYFGFSEDDSEFEKSVALIAGIAPRPYMMKYLNQESVSIGSHRLPSVSPAPFMIAGVIASEVTNILLGKAAMNSVPTVHQFDGLLHTYKKHRFRWGMRSPLQRLKKRVLRAKLKGAR